MTAPTRASTFTLYGLVFVTSALWGLLADVNDEATYRLYQRGYGRISSIYLFAFPPTLMFILSIALSLWLAYRGYRGSAFVFSWLSLGIWILYFFGFVAPTAAI
jgi:hypothetical protein